MKRDLNALEHDTGNLPPFVSRSTHVPTPKQRMDNWELIHPIFANLDRQFKQQELRK